LTFDFTQNNKAIKQKANMSNLLSQMLDTREKSDILTLIQTVDFAAQKHACQKRKGSEESYIIHPIGVARILAEEAKVTDLRVLQAAILHDTIEDTDASYKEIRDKFGVEVADIVQEVTDDKSLPKLERKKHQVAHVKHISREAKLVKMADKIHNLQSVSPNTWSSERVLGYVAWAQEVVNQGLRGVNDVLEARLDQIFEGYDLGPGILDEYYEMMSQLND